MPCVLLHSVFRNVCVHALAYMPFAQSCRVDGGQSHNKFVHCLLASRSLHRIYALSTETYKLAMATMNEHCLII